MSQKGNLLKTEYGHSYCWNKIKANCFRPTTAILLKTFSSNWRLPLKKMFPNTKKSQNGNLVFTTTEYRHFYNKNNFGTWKCPTTAIIIKNMGVHWTCLLINKQYYFFSNTGSSHTAITNGVWTSLLKIFFINVSKWQLIEDGVRTFLLLK